jgi:hypothetical protein
MAKQEAKTRSIQCHHCKVETEHKLLCRRDRRGEEEVGHDDYRRETAWWSVSSEVYQCGGCKELVIRRVSNHEYADFPSEDFYPPREKEKSRKITLMSPGQGFTANLVTALPVAGASGLGLPVSTTHVSVGSLFVIGVVNRQARVRTVLAILVAWATTLPTGVALAAVACLVLRAV